MNLILAVVFGLVFGSFTTAVSYRLPKGIDFIRGRSYCPKCKKQIRWYDNIPLISFLLLKGKCRDCKRKIPLRYPLIELATTGLFVAVIFVALSCSAFNSPLCALRGGGVLIFYPFLLFIALISELVFIIDLEHRLIPDGLVFAGLVVTTAFLILVRPDLLYLHLLTALVFAFLLLVIHLATRGRGMGLGDVKFALLPGLVLGWPLSLVWFFGAFLTGATVAIILILTGRAHRKDKIAFGPFLVISFLLIALFGNTFLAWLIH